MRNKIGLFASELIEFTRFSGSYLASRLLDWGGRLEKVKDIIVAVLVVKRGKYSQSFLNTSFFFLVSAVMIGGPVIAENNPFIDQYVSAEEEASEEAVLQADIYSLPIDTRISQKPRDKVIEYVVKKDDTLDKLAQKFDVSEDTIKWANNIKGNIIKEGQKLEIPPITGVVHKVAQGESVYSIAKKYQTDPQKIVNFPFNDYTDLETFALASGQTLYVPDGVIEEAKPLRPRLGPSRTDIIAGAPGTGSFIWPTTGYISQYPVWYHMAIDIANKGLPPVLASDGGTVNYAACGGAYGCHIIVNHNNGYSTLYAHLSSIGVGAGQQVGRGETIGRVGSTGRSTGPHLHFEIMAGGAKQNPLGYLK